MKYHFNLICVLMKFLLKYVLGFVLLNALFCVSGWGLTEDEVQAKLDAIQVAEFRCKDEPLSEAIKSLEALSVQLDSSKVAPKGVRMVVRDADSDPLVTIRLRSLSMSQVLRFVCSAVAFEWTIESGMVVVRPLATGVSVDESGDGLVTEVFPVQSSTVIRLTGFSGNGVGGAPVDPFAPASPGAVQGRSAPNSTFRNPVYFSSAEVNVVSSGDFNTEAYDVIIDNPFLSPLSNPLSTFSIDVDTASYSNVRRMIEGGRLPNADAVRIEELINYFPYEYDAPRIKADVVEDSNDVRDWVEHPLALHTEVGPALWNKEHRLIKIGLKGHEVDWSKHPPANLVFLLDVSGSMGSPKKLPLVKESMKLLIDRMNERDRIAIVVYAGASGLALPSTSCDQKEVILKALESLQAGGSTNAGEGLELAYKIAKQHFVEGGLNRVILCTDGDFNVGVVSKGELTERLEAHAKEGIFFTALGFGMGNYKDDMLEQLSNKGNGNYAYIDSRREARKVFIQGVAGTLMTIAKDVKIQVEFNPAQVKAYRLIGYENRLLRAEDFNDDAKDAGEVGSGHTVTALYEIALHGDETHLPDVDALKYQKRIPVEGGSNELLTVKYRYKWPDAEVSKKWEHAVLGEVRSFADCSDDFRFASAIASWGMLLRDSPFRGDSSVEIVKSTAEGSLGKDSGGHRIGFLECLEQSSALLKKRAVAQVRK